ncbi:MAG: UdgX family uracil-DNA binding protein [Burkholderiaceae bacterium]
MTHPTVDVTLASVTDWAGFSRAIRALRDERAAPASVRWHFRDDDAPDLFDDGTARDAHAMPDAGPLALPKSFVEAARQVFLNGDDGRLPLLHRMAMRIADSPAAWADPLDADRLQFDRLQREVRREIHKMHAFVRFRPLDEPGTTAATGDAPTAGSTRHVAWFDPAHHVVEAAAPFFARRFATMRWAILTPRACVEWDGRSLAFRPGAVRAQAPAADAGEALWLAYYRSIFNPARLKVAMMKREMPVRFWKNLPEAATIGPLIAGAPSRAGRMIDDGGAARERRRGQLDIDRTAGDRPEGSALDADPDGRSPGARAGLEAIRRSAARCRDCPIADAATQTVFGEGDPSARLMIVGEQPGDREDLRGRPFQGPAGQLLRAAFQELGWESRALYLTNAVKHFHHELRGKRRIHRTPSQREAEACLHWLEAEIAALRPRAIVALGATAARSLLGRDVGVLGHEGTWLVREDGLPVLVCRHPAAILRADARQRPALQARWIGSLAPATGFLA